MLNQKKEIKSPRHNIITSFCILIIVFCLSVTEGYSQAKASGGKDSILLNQTSTLLRKIDSTKKSDSIRKNALIQEIENLRGSEVNKQREALLKKLKAQEIQDSLHKVYQEAQLDKLKASAVAYAVAPFGDTLFLVHTNVGSFSPADRAKSISEKIEKLYGDYGFHVDSLKVFHGETSAEIGYNNIIVMSVNELEAMWFEKKTTQLAEEYKTKIQDAIRAEREAYSILNIGLRIAAVLLIILGIYLVILLINKIFKRIVKKVISLKDSILKGVRFRGYQFLDSDREMRLALFILNVFRLFIIILALYIALPLLFSVFPWTQGIAETLIGWVLDPIVKVFRGLINYLPNLFTIAVIVAVTYYFGKFLEFIAEEIETGELKIPDFYPDWARPTLNIVRFLLYAFGFIIIFPYLPGSDSPIFQGVSVFVGILFSLGSSSAISNAVAGLVITYMRPFKVGDRIKIGEISGDVIEKTLLVTRIRTIKNEDITVPNSSILSGHTINYTTSAAELGLILHTSVTIGYDVPWKQVHELLIKAAVDTADILKDEYHHPFVLQTSLDDFYVSYQLNAYTDQSNKMAGIYSGLHQNIQDKFNEAGVEIMSPHYRAARDGNMTTVPSAYLDKNYKAPSFNVSMKNPDKKSD